jgi:hypothetical protein
MGFNAFVAMGTRQEVDTHSVDEMCAHASKDVVVQSMFNVLWNFGKNNKLILHNVSALTFKNIIASVI